MWEQIAANRRRSAFLVVMMAGLLGALGWALGESQVEGGGLFGIGLAAVVWLILTLVAWFQGDSIYLAMSGARKVSKADLPVLYDVVEEMTIASGLPTMPAIYVIDDAAPNAFATGRKPETASVAVTSGLLKALNRDELQGVVAHELGHIRNRDILLMLFAGVMVGAIVLLAQGGMRGLWYGGGRRSRRSEGGGGGAAIIMLIAVALMILAPIIAQLIYFAISRKREYLADASAAAYTRYPEGLASALEKIAAAPKELLRGANRASAPMYIVNPLQAAGADARAASAASATHPPIAERVRILRAMGGGASFQDYERSYREVTGKGGVLPRSALEDAHAGAGLRIQGEGWRRGAAAAEAPAAATLASAATSAEALAVAAAAEPRLRAREVDDFFYKQQGYARIECPCGNVLKVPPGLTATSVKCPSCGRRHEVAWGRLG
jgi:heat shock protein HtpX